MLVYKCMSVSVCWCVRGSPCLGTASSNEGSCLPRARGCWAQEDPAATERAALLSLHPALTTKPWTWMKGSGYLTLHTFKYPSPASHQPCPDAQVPFEMARAPASTLPSTRDPRAAPGAPCSPVRSGWRLLF